MKCLVIQNDCILVGFTQTQEYSQHTVSFRILKVLVIVVGYNIWYMFFMKHVRFYFCRSVKHSNYISSSFYWGGKNAGSFNFQFSIEEVKWDTFIVKNSYRVFRITIAFNKLQSRFVKYFVFINVIVTCLELLDAHIVLDRNSYHFEVVQLFSEIFEFQSILICQLI